MLKNMNTDLVKQGIRAASKGICGACGKPVMGEVSLLFIALLNQKSRKSDFILMFLLKLTKRIQLD